jgi:flavin-binding protein dodecin
VSAPAASVRHLLNRNEGENIMTVAKITEITSTSTKSFDDAIQTGIKRATKRLKNVTSAWVQDQEVAVKNNKVSEYRVRLRITFVLND